MPNTWIEESRGEGAVLIIEHENALVSWLQAFSSSPMSISGTSDAVEAAGLLEAIRPDFLLINPSIDGGMALLQVLRRRLPRIATIVVTASDDIAGKVRRLGVDHVIIHGLPGAADAALHLVTDHGSAAMSTGTRVLLVDQEVIVRDAFSDFLESRGYVPVTVGSGQEALDLTGNDPGIRMVFLDLLLPDMGGLETLWRFRRASYSSGIIMTSVLADREIARHARRLGAFDYLLKPYAPEAAEAAIVACLADSEYRRQSWLKRMTDAIHLTTH